MQEPRTSIEAAEENLRQRIGAAGGWDAACDEAALALTAALLRARVEQKQILARLTPLGVSRRGAKQLVKAVLAGRRATVDAAAARKQERLAQAEPLCPHCMTPVGRLDHFCPKCCGPITTHASIDPMGQVYSIGRMYQQAASAPEPKRIVVLGIWLILAPQIPWLLLGLFLSVSELFAPGHVYDLGKGWHLYTNAEYWPPIPLFRLLLIGGMLSLYVAILVKVTLRYRRGKLQAR